jgi:hypothetical protein
MIDDGFKLIGRVSSSDHESKEFKNKIKCYENFVLGMIRGALFNLGFENQP